MPNAVGLEKRPAAFSFAGKLYVSGNDLDTYKTFGGTPAYSISGSNTGISLAAGVAPETAPNGYTAIIDGGKGAGNVAFFAPQANGNVAPVKTIFGSNSGLQNVYSMTADAAGNIYVGLNEGGGILVFSAHASGNVAPVRILSTGSSKITIVTGLLVVGKTLYVSTWNPDRVAIYDAGTTGSSTPTGYIQGSHSQTFWHPEGMAVDSKGYLYVALRNYPAVGVYSPGATGDAKPVRVLTGSTQFAAPSSLAIDSSDNLYVFDNASSTSSIVYAYPPGSNGTGPFLAKFAAKAHSLWIAWHK